MSAASVVDASIVFKRLVIEEYTEHARAMVDDSIRSVNRLLAPPIIRSEIANALLQRHRRGGLSAPEATGTLALFLELPIEVIDDERLYPEALTMAMLHEINNAYDCLYLSLAMIRDVE